MGSEIQSAIPVPEAPPASVPWRFMDNWIAVFLLALIDILLLIFALQGPRPELFQTAFIVFLELAYLLPVVLILAWRRVHWKHLGFGRFEWSTLGLGCGLLIAAFFVIYVHNVLLLFFGVEIQGEEIARLLAELESPVWFFIVGAIIAPPVEEIFFRGFLFQGFRQQYGWKNSMLLSSAIFAAAHLDLVALIPTFILGNVLAYVYHRSNSVWPGIILHFLVNALGLCSAYFLSQYPNLIPS